MSGLLEQYPCMTSGGAVCPPGCTRQCPTNILELTKPEGFSWANINKPVPSGVVSLPDDMPTFEELRERNQTQKERILATMAQADALHQALNALVNKVRDLPITVLVVEVVNSPEFAFAQEILQAESEEDS